MRALLPLLFLVACGADPTPAAPEPTPVEQPDEEVDDLELEEDVEELDPPTPHNLDEMDRSELEAACFEGSQAACDRLGH